MQIEERIKRIEYFENIFDEALKNVETLNKAFEEFEQNLKKLDELEKYYTDGRYIEDYEFDEKALLPKDLKRGILSEDGIYNLLIDIDRYRLMLNKSDKE